MCRDRQSSYGDTENNFQNIADLLNILLQRKLKDPFDALDVATMLNAVKEARKIHNPDYLDNWIDGAGYNVCGAGIIMHREERARSG